MIRALLVLALLAAPLPALAEAAQCRDDLALLAGANGRVARFRVEIADDAGERAQGLMGRAALAQGTGMLFVYETPRPASFWMKNTLIPLDMLFFDANHRLVAIQADAQPCKADPCRVYPSDVPARYVLELNAGVAGKLGARKGDVITFSNVSSGTQ